MTILDDCIAAAVKAGEMTAKGAAEYAARMRDAERVAAQHGLSGPDAYTFATTEVAKKMEAKATSNRAQVQKTILAVDRNWENAKANERGVGYGLTNVLGERVFGKTEGPSIGLQHRGNMAALQSIMSDFLAQVQSKKLGTTRNVILPRHVVSELFGRATGSEEAKAAAGAWNQAIKWWMDGMHAAGVPIGKLEDWRLPQHFDSNAVRKMGEQAWIEQMDSWWRDGHLRIRDWNADGEAYFVPGSDGEADVARILKTAHDNITSGGDVSIKPGEERNFTMADRYGRRRAFEWASDDAWLAFNDMMGVGNDAIGELLVKHMDNVARDLSVAQVLGPDPDKAARTLIQMYQQQGDHGWKQRLWASKLNAIYEINSGKASAPVSQELALAGSSLRQGLSAVQLGGAVLSATSDFGFTKATASWHDLSMSRIMQDYLGRLGPGTVEGRAQAMRSGLIQEVGLRGLHNIATDVIDDIKARKATGGTFLNGLSRTTGRMAEVVIRAQGLAHHTQILRDAIGAEVQGHFGELVERTWDQLPPIDRRTLTEYGLSQANWDALRTGGVTKGFIDPAKLAREAIDGPGREAGVKMLGAIAGIQRMAVPEGNSVTRAMLLGATRPGTYEGEFMRSIAQYKGFPLTAFLNHYFRSIEGLRDGEGQWFRGSYIAGLMVSTTVLGGLGLQLKQIAAGKDPEPMFSHGNGAKFWLNAWAQGGAGGIFAQQIQAMFSAQRIGDPSRLVTPVSGLALDLQGLFQGNVQDAIAGREPHMGREAVRFASKYTPEVFYTKRAMQYLVWDTLTRMVDPDANGTFNRIEERARKQDHNEFFFRPGTTPWHGGGPQRGPDFLKAVELPQLLQ